MSNKEPYNKARKNVIPAEKEETVCFLHWKNWKEARRS